MYLSYYYVSKATESPYMDKRKEHTETPPHLLTETQIRANIRARLLRWHDDVNQREAAIGSGQYSVSTVLTALLNAPTLSLVRWPRDIPDETSVTISGIERPIYLPETPDEFLKLLAALEKEKNVPKQYFKPSHLNRREYTGTGMEVSDNAPEQELVALKEMVTKSESIEELARLLDLFSLFGGDQIRSIGLPEVYENQARLLFMRELSHVEALHQVNVIKEQLAAFRFYTKESRPLLTQAIQEREKSLRDTYGDSTSTELVDQETLARGIQLEMDRAARVYLVARVRETTSTEELHALETFTSSISFLNRGELGVIRSVLNRKLRRLAE